MPPAKVKKTRLNMTKFSKSLRTIFKYEKNRFMKEPELIRRKGNHYIILSQLSIRQQENCEFDVMKEQMICDRLVVGIRGKPLSQHLQIEYDFILEKAKWPIQ